MSFTPKFKKDDKVKIDSPGHRMDGKVGLVLYWGSFLGTYGVEFDHGDNAEGVYGFLEGELNLVEQRTN